ncbi:MAG: hypothetical protein IJ873_03210 [Lachnospiraceae bacterium]|nr:hypothetical protein [Lachnospiraceae bacterium]
MNYGDDYESADDWQKADAASLYDDSLYDSLDGGSMVLSDARSASYEGGFIADLGGDDYMVLMLFSDNTHGEFAVRVSPDGFSVGSYLVAETEYPSRGLYNGVRFELYDGRWIDYFEDSQYIVTEAGNVFPTEYINEEEAREFISADD